MRGLDEVRLIDSEGEQLGVMAVKDALERAKEKDLDLVLIAPKADPPVCRITDYGRYKYEKEKREKENKRKQQEVKGIKIRPNTATHDLETSIRSAIKFIKEGHKVRIVCLFRPRELQHPEVGKEKLSKIAESVGEIAKMDAEPKLSGKEMVMVLSPSAGGKK
jgi:translation initiation factor IF-3